MRKWSIWCLCGLMASNIAGVSYYVAVEKRIAGIRRPAVTEVGGTFPAFSGIDLHGARCNSQDPPCRVIRITDDNCSFCKRDQASYQKLVSAAHRASCEIVEMSPKAGRMADAPGRGIIQLQYVDTDIGSVLAPFATPHTVLLDREWSLAWGRRGALDEGSVADALAALNMMSNGLAKEVRD